MESNDIIKQQIIEIECEKMKIKRIKTRVILLFVILVLLSAGSLSAKSLPDSLEIKINALFAQWDNVNSPGCVVGIVRNDSLIFAKGYGIANLEYAVPNTPQTIYHMASISKQFTAYAVLLLAKEGRLQLDDDIRKYLIWFPDLKKKVTIRNLLNHTSGIRDQWQLLAIAGTRLNDVITQDHIVKILSRQQTLNFDPGEQYSYSNSGFTLLAEIVRTITGKSLRQFSDSVLFKPLGMNNTNFHDNSDEIVKNRSYSYQKSDSNQYSNSILSYSNAGATSLFTNIGDMSKWIMNFYDPKVGDKNDIALLTQKGKLNNGKELDYASGIVSNTWKGWRQFSHSGGDAGYRTYMTVFPDLKMGFVVCSNVGDFNPSAKTYQMAGFFIKDTTNQKTTIKAEKGDSTSTLIKDELSIKKYLGEYIGNDGNTCSLEIKKSRLYFRNYREEKLLVRESENTFSEFNASDIKFSFKIQSGDTIVEIATPDTKYHFEKCTKASMSDKLLQTYAGIYYCPELDCRYGLVLKNHQLFLTNTKYSDTPVTFFGSEHLRSDFWWMNHLLIQRNQSNRITGFEVNSGRIMHLKFNKTE